MNELTELEERIKRRQLRRWKRRGRIVAPFAALPVLLATLVLSIDIIEYSPKERREKTVERTTHRQVKSIQPSPAARAAISMPAIAPENVLDAEPMKLPSLELDREDPNAVNANLRPAEFSGGNR